MRDAYRSALEVELRRRAGVTASFSSRRKHRQVVLEVGTRKRFITYPSTPGEYRGLRNCVALLRGTLRALGATMK